MKKSILALVMALTLCLSTFAMAETAPAIFDFTVEEYVEGYTKFCTDFLNKDPIWSEPVEEENRVGVQGSAEGMIDPVVYSTIDDPACIAINTQCDLGIGSEDMTAQAQAFGVTVAAIPFATRYLETGYDAAALQNEISEMETACQKLVQMVFSSDAITSAMSEPYTETAVIGGHNAELTLKVNVADMTMSVTFQYMP